MALKSNEGKVRRLPGADVLERAAFQQRAFQRQLRRQQRVRLAARRRRPGLVIQDVGHAGGPQVDAVGAAGERGARFADRQRLGALFRPAPGYAVGAAAFPVEDVAGKCFETRPPYGLHVGGQRDLGKARSADVQQDGRRVRACGVDIGLREPVHDFMKQRAALGSTRIADQRLDRDEPKDAPGIDGVGVAAQRLDLGHRKTLRPRVEPRLRFRALDERLLRSLVQRPRPAKQFVAARAQLPGMIVAGEGQEPLQPARRHRRRVAGAGGAGEHHFFRSHRRPEIVRGKADAAFRRLEVDARLHDARHEAVGLGAARPAALVQPAQHQRVDRLQARFERPPDGDAAVASGRRLDHLRGDQRAENVRPLRSREVQRGGGGQNLAQETGEFLAGVFRVELGEIARRTAADVLKRLDGGAHDVGQVHLAHAAKRQQRLQRSVQACQQLPRLGAAPRIQPGEP